MGMNAEERDPKISTINMARLAIVIMAKGVVGPIVFTK